MGMTEANEPDNDGALRGGRAYSFGRLAGWLPVLLTLLVGGAASWAIIDLHRNGDRAEQAQITVAEIQRNVQNAANIFSTRAPLGPHRVAAAAPPPGGLSVTGLQADNLSRLGALRSITGDRAQIAVVSRELMALNGALKPSASPGGPAAAHARGKHIASRLEQSLDRLADTIRGQGRHASTLSGVGTWLITLFAAAAVGILLRRLDRRRRLEAERHAEALRALALIDPLTGLGNRRQLEHDLTSATERATLDHPLRLSLFDLDGFKSYNDTFGHHEGDLLLRRLALALKEATGPSGRAYRLGGDEFCVLTWSSGENMELDARLRDSLCSSGEGFSIGASAGIVLLPSETHDSETAMQWADARMYADKDSGRLSAGEQTRNVALNMLAAHESGLLQHSARVAGLAREVGKRLEMGPSALDELVRAAELHDVGKVAIPFSILEKPGPLDDEEWEMIRRHPVVGANILNSAPALTAVSAIVRSAHERFDGDGYPDGLAGDAIPLASRIIFACDAFDAMTSDRAYRDARSEDQALAELERGTGTQFDSLVVAAFQEANDATHRIPAPSPFSDPTRQRGPRAQRPTARPDVALG
jgi:diguanylate cyclase (GGDEF)-like protein